MAQRGALRNLSSRARAVVLLTAVALFLAAPPASSQQCPFDARPPTSDPHDLNFNGVLSGNSVTNVHIFNFYLSNKWDQILGDPPQAQITLATQAAIAAGYFRRACQYSSGQVFWKGSGNTDNVFDGACGALGNVPGTIALGPLLHFFTCQEAIGQAGAPAVGVPNLVACGGCEATGGFDCFLTLPGTCLSTPNPSGDTIYNLLIPADTTLDELPGGGATAFHFQIPSNRFGAIPGVGGTGVPLTSGRPLYIAFIPVANNPTFNQLMAAITHEDVEAYTDPFPGASWINNAISQSHAGDGEAADICKHIGQALYSFSPPAMIDGLKTMGLPPFTVAKYWSNDSHSCPVPFIFPSTMPSSLPPPNANGWNRTGVTITLTATEPGGSGVASITYSATGAQPIAPTIVNGSTAIILVTAEGLTTLSFAATDSLGLTESPAKTTTVQVDETPPVVTYSGNAGLYTVDQLVNITCTATDALSGVASTTCTDINGPAYAFYPQATFSATAIDRADNVGQASVTFKVMVTFGSLTNLAVRFERKNGVAASLVAKLVTAHADAARGDNKAADNVLSAFIQEVSAQAGKSLTTDQANILAFLAGQLM